MLATSMRQRGTREPGDATHNRAPCYRQASPARRRKQMQMRSRCLPGSERRRKQSKACDRQARQAPRTEARQRATNRSSQARDPTRQPRSLSPVSTASLESGAVSPRSLSPVSPVSLQSLQSSQSSSHKEKPAYSSHKKKPV